MMKMGLEIILLKLLSITARFYVAKIFSSPCNKKVVSSVSRLKTEHFSQLERTTVVKNENWVTMKIILEI